MNTYSLILAGGSGTRFWPLSRKGNPKQILNLSGVDTLISEAISRFSQIVSEENIYIVTASEQLPILVSAISPESKVGYITEPIQRGTAACILMSVLKLYKQYGDMVVCISPSDHYITNILEFTNKIQEAFVCAETTNKIVTIGIQPTFPSTGYGYISCDFDKKANNAYMVKEFVEKPDYIHAKEFVSAKNYFWNSGMFIFKASVIIENFKRFLPRVYEKLMIWYDLIGTDQEKDILEKVYSEVQSISIDYGIMERSNDIYVIPADMGWNDIGSWDSLGCLFPPDENGNIIRAKTVSIGTKNCVIYSEKSLIATLGVEDMIIVDCEDALLICPKSEAQHVKRLVQMLEEKNLTEFL
jgi:mannose-1-phosphate guanylyltransferase